jgi:hypothetical protein
LAKACLKNPSFVYFSYSWLAILQPRHLMFGTKYPVLRHSDRTTQFYSPYMLVFI